MKKQHCAICGTTLLQGSDKCSKCESLVSGIVFSSSNVVFIISEYKDFVSSVEVFKDSKKYRETKASHFNGENSYDYEYEISQNPISVRIRLVDDGYFLDEDYNKDDLEWHDIKLDSAYSYALLFFILYKNQEVITPENLKNFLNDLSKKIKTNKISFLNKDENKETLNYINSFLEKQESLWSVGSQHMSVTKLILSLASMMFLSYLMSLFLFVNTFIIFIVWQIISFLQGLTENLTYSLSSFFNVNNGDIKYFKIKRIVFSSLLTFIFSFIVSIFLGVSSINLFVGFSIVFLTNGYIWNNFINSKN